MSIVVRNFVKRIGLIAILIFILLVVAFKAVWKAGEEVLPLQEPDVPEARPKVDLSGCKHVYLDVGSNVGVQVRKLYEPERYDGANVHPIFKTYFGEDIRERRSTVCSVGFEPNPAHAQRLKNLQDAYNRCGWRVHFFTGTAVSDHNGFATLFTDRNQRVLEWGASILGGRGKVGQVSLLRLRDFINELVVNRELPSGEPPGKIVMKMDIEGSEVDVLPDLLSGGSLGQVDLLMIEWHEHLAHTKERLAASEALRKLVETGNVTTVSSVDDETYGKSHFPLPNCDNGVQ